MIILLLPIYIFLYMNSLTAHYSILVNCTEIIFYTYIICILCSFELFSEVKIEINLIQEMNLRLQLQLSISFYLNNVHAYITLFEEKMNTFTDFDLISTIMKIKRLKFPLDYLIIMNVSSSISH